MRRAVYAGVDWFRLPAALLVIAIHTAPLSGISKGLDAAVTYGLGRIAVPFFLMTTGYFLLAPCFGEKPGSRERWRRFERKILLIYAASTLLYLPVAWYAGNLPGNLTEAVRMLLFDGTFYHLWYFPALLIGGRIALGLGRAGYRKALTAAGNPVPDRTFRRQLLWPDGRNSAFEKIIWISFSDQQFIPETGSFIRLCS